MTIEVIDEITEPEDVDLQSFEEKDELCPSIWKDNSTLFPKVRAMLLVIARDFMKDIGIDMIEPKDIIMTGSLANYNWDRKFSDIDLHILMDTSRISNKKDFVEKYLKMSRGKWNDEHEIRIEGFPIEAYVQDVNEPHDSTGVYSLIDRKWIVEPSRGTFDYNEMNDSKIREKAAEFSNEIEDLENEAENAGTPEQFKAICRRADGLLTKIKNYRAGGKKRSNFETSTNNIVFKYLRRYDRIKALTDVIKKSYDMSHSYNSRGPEN